MRAGSFYQNYREVRLLVVHCSATRCDRNFSIEALQHCHIARGFASIGYHFYITRDGEVHICRPVYQIGAHASGWNDKSIGICYEGGLNESSRPADTRTYAQKCSLLDLLRQLKTDYPEARIIGHINSVYWCIRHVLALMQERNIKTYNNTNTDLEFHRESKNSLWNSTFLSTVVSGIYL